MLNKASWGPLSCSGLLGFMLMLASVEVLVVSGFPSVIVLMGSDSTTTGSGTFIQFGLGETLSWEAGAEVVTVVCIASDVATKSFFKLKTLSSTCQVLMTSQ